MVYHEEIKKWMTMRFPFSYRSPLVILVALCLINIFLVAAERVEQGPINFSESKSKGYLFMEVSRDTDEKSPPGCLNFSCFRTEPLIGLSYIFSESKLIALKYLNLTPAPIKVIVGYRQCSNGGLYQVTKVPFSVCNFNITNISNDIVTADYLGHHFVLKPGDSWSKRTEEILVGEDGNTTITTNVTVENHGHVEVVLKGSPLLERCDGIWC